MRKPFETDDLVFIKEIIFDDRPNGLADIFASLRDDPSSFDRLAPEELLAVGWWIVQARGYEVDRWRLFDVNGRYRACGWNGATELATIIECDVTGEPITPDHLRNLREFASNFNHDTITIITKSHLPPAVVVAMSLRCPVEVVRRETIVEWAGAALQDGASRLAWDYYNTLMTVGTIGLEPHEFGRLLLPTDMGDQTFQELAARLALPREYVQQLDRVQYFPFDMIKALGREPRLLHGLTPRMFEEFIAELLVRLGFENLELTSFSGDGGRDIVATRRIHQIPITFFFECKKYAEGNKIQLDTIRSLLGVVAHHNRSANKGVLVTTSRFTKGSLELIASDCRLDGKDFDGVSDWLRSIRR